MRTRLRLVSVLLALLAFLAPGATAQGARKLPPIKHVFILVLENKAFDEAFAFNSPAPYLSQTLPAMGALLTQYYGIGHDSTDNYLAMISGQGPNVASQADCQNYSDFTPGTPTSNGQYLGEGCVYPRAVATIANQLEAHGFTWKAYLEGMNAGAPVGQERPCRHVALNSKDSGVGAYTDGYVPKHNPFVYFHSIIDFPTCQQHDVDLSHLSEDLRSSSQTPNYSFIVPTMCDDDHNSPCLNGAPGGLSSANSWLRVHVPPILHSPAFKDRGLLVVLFDEAHSLDENQALADSSACCGEMQSPNTPANGGLGGGLGGGRTGAVMLSPYIDPGTIDHVAYNHFSLLRSVEDLFGLGHLGYAAQAGLGSLGSDVFTCYEPRRPRARHHRLPRGSEIKLAAIAQGTSRRPMLELKLWHPGRVTVTLVRSGKRRHRRRVLMRRRRPGSCQLLKVRLRSAHGRAIVTVRAFGGTERRTLRF